MKKVRRINLSSFLSENEIEKQKLSKITGGLMLFPCACWRTEVNRSQALRRAI
jgi:natural product precursor